MFKIVQPCSKLFNIQSGKKDEEGYESGEDGEKDELVVMKERVERMECSTGTLLFKIDSFLVELEAIERSKEKRMKNLGRLIDRIAEVVWRGLAWCGVAW